ncbi:hypothetical protein AQUCO_08100022v1 [Aquilegia coerulea]|uniref:Uncharacterized protein n=1 Tax=Aquilegia coerulea TaxID=218851 RepID=A0A2G5C7L6_AQUCA|nr:hypothetical protein AQUCO_08100022v1 [Aquilegia coerulea]
MNSLAPTCFLWIIMNSFTKVHKNCKQEQRSALDFEPYSNFLVHRNVFSGSATQLVTRSNDDLKRSWKNSFS